jgi:hypothetical protein
MSQQLKLRNIESLFGQYIKWTAPSSNYNAPYQGIAKIVSLKGFSARRPLVTVTIAGDDLEYARVDEWDCFVYSDDFRFVTYEIVNHI